MILLWTVRLYYQHAHFWSQHYCYFLCFYCVQLLCRLRVSGMPGVGWPFSPSIRYINSNNTCSFVYVCIDEGIKYINKIFRIHSRLWIVTAWLSAGPMAFLWNKINIFVECTETVRCAHCIWRPNYLALRYEFCYTCSRVTKHTTQHTLVHGSMQIVIQKPQHKYNINAKRSAKAIKRKYVWS